MTEPRLVRARQLLEAAEDHVTLLEQLHNMTMLERLVYSISHSPTIMKISGFLADFFC
jgi:hypothetical protein